MTAAWYHEHNIYAIPENLDYILGSPRVTTMLFGAFAGAGFAAVFVLWTRWASRSRLGTKEYGEGLLINTGAPAPHAPGDRPLRLVTLNAGYASGAANNTPKRVPLETSEANLDRIGRTLARLKADFVVLQEVDLDSARSHGIDQLEWIRRHTGHAFSAFAYNWDVRYLPWPYWPPTAHFGRILSGQALLSRFPIRQHRKVTFPKPDSQPNWYNRFFIDRALHLCEVDLAGRALHLAGCHLESFHIDSRRKQARLVTDAIAALSKMPLILAGDFNAIPSWATPPPILHEAPKDGEAADDTIAHIESVGLQPLFSADRWQAREETSYTYASFMPVACIDNAFCSEEIEIVDGGVCRDSGDASDHFPVWMDFRLRERA